MNKEQFLSTLRERISGLPQEEIKKSLDYYSEMIDDRIEDGMTEEQAVAEIGSVEDAVSQILSEQSLGKLVRAKVKPSRALRGWEIVLLILGSPLWLPLILAALAVFLSFYLVIWAVIITLYAVDLAFGISGIAGLIGAVMLLTMGRPMQLLMLLGIGLVLIGLTVLLFFAFTLLARAILLLSKKFLLCIKSMFIKKGDNR